MSDFLFSTYPPQELPTVQLLTSSENILKQGSNLAATGIFKVDDSPSLDFSVEIYDSFLESIFNKSKTFYLSCFDSAGEYFDFITDFNRIKEPFVQDFLLSCSGAIGLMVVIDGTSSSFMDNYYLERFEVLRKELSNHSYNNYRLAVVFSKADQPRIWNSLQNLEGFFRKAFPLTYELLQDWNSEKGFSIEYFACSSFGMIGNSFRANAKNMGTEHSYVLLDPELWNPFGIIYPLYWIATGVTNKKLQFAEINNDQGFRKNKLLIGMGSFLSLLVLLPLLIFGFSNKIEFINSSSDNICRQSLTDEEQQLKEVEKKIVQSLEKTQVECQKKLDELLFRTGLNQATKGFVPVAIDRFCRISKSSPEELVGASAFISRWKEDNHWKTMVQKQLSSNPNCPAAQ